MPRPFRHPFIAAAALALFAVLAPTSARADTTDTAIDARTRNSAIDALLLKLKEEYIFPEVAAELEREIRARQQVGRFDRIVDGSELAETFTGILHDLGNDQHLSMRYAPGKRADAGIGIPESDAESRQRMQRFGVAVNFGFEKAERLPGNIGYLHISSFMPAEVGAETAAAAMNFLAHTDALIVDLRNNYGGEPNMVAFISSYLFDDDTVQLNDLYYRRGDRTRQHWTLPHVPGRRYGDKPVFILTSHSTPSAAEEFAYNLQVLERATIIGETTRGMANPGEEFALGNGFSAFIPTGRAINPITGTNWEGVGVRPDIAVSATAALTIAHRTALELLLQETQDAGARKRFEAALAALPDSE